MKSISQMVATESPLNSSIRHAERPDVVSKVRVSNGSGLSKPEFLHTLAQADQRASELKAWQVGLLSAVVVLLIGAADNVTPLDLTFSLFYLAPVAFAAWYSTRNLGLIISALTTVVWLAVELQIRPEGSLSILLLNSVFRFLMFGFVSVIVSRLRALQSSLKREVRSALDRVEREVSRRLDIEREIAVASHREQQRIAYDLHDGLGQELGGLAFQSKMLAAKLAEGGSPLAQDAERVVRMLNFSIGRTRALSRLLDPVGNDSGGLRDALSQLADYSGEAFSVACTFTGPSVIPKLSGEADLHLYRIAQEAIRNAVEHGQATDITVTLELNERTLTLSVVDNGKGVGSPRPQTLRGRGMGPGSHTGHHFKGKLWFACDLRHAVA
jgi:signal transduction histidine kinase